VEKKAFIYEERASSDLGRENSCRAREKVWFSIKKEKKGYWGGALRVPGGKDCTEIRSRAQSLSADRRRPFSGLLRKGGRSWREEKGAPRLKKRESGLIDAEGRELRIKENRVILRGLAGPVVGAAR